MFLKHLYNKLIFYNYFFKKRPNFILVIDNFRTASHEMLITYKEKYNLSKIILFDDRDPSLNCENFTKEHGCPDLVILTGDVQSFKFKDPLILYKAEIWFSRKSFCEETFFAGLYHYSECEMREGK
ncbi:hypothetical protein COBT_000062 [Conglomerata obtusa]